MSNPSRLGALVYQAESAFGEDFTTFTTFRLPTIGPIDVSGLVHNKIDPDRTRQYRQDGTPYVLGTMGGSITTKMYLCGHGSTTAGATAVTSYETLLGLVFGGGPTVSAASGTTAAGGTATVPTTVASGTFTAGTIAFFGAANDARGGGQAVVVSSHSTTTLNLIAGIAAVPTAGDVIFSGVNMHCLESPIGSPMTSVRFAALSGNLSYELHGCVPTGYTISGLNPGETPTIEVTWSVAWWRYTTSVTFPTLVASDTTNPAVCAGGSLFVQDVGTASRATRSYRNLSIDCTVGVELLKGPGGVNAYQDTIGAVRTTNDYKISWTEEADAATTTPVLPGFGTAGVAKHVLWTSATAAGSRIAIYMPNVHIINVATQRADQNLNRLTVEGMACTGPNTANAITLSALRVAFA